MVTFVFGVFATLGAVVCLASGVALVAALANHVLGRAVSALGLHSAFVEFLFARGRARKAALKGDKP